MKKRFSAIASAALLFAPLGAQAVPVLDQSFEKPVPTLWSIIGVFNSPAPLYFYAFQSFTVGVSGAFSSIDVFVERAGVPTENLIVEIVSGSNPTGSALASSFVTPSSVSTTASFVSADFSAASLSVSAGDFLGFRLSSLQSITGDVNYGARGWAGGGYSGGSGKQICDSSHCTDQTWDYFFKTYVDTAAVAVPEPATFALFVFGLAGLGVLRRRAAS